MLDAVYEYKTVRSADMDTELRWPTFARRAANDTGVHDTLAFQLFVENDNLVALNLFSTQPNAFTDDSEDIGLLVAAHAAVAYAEARKISQLGKAVDIRDLIGQAKGILMERHSLTGQRAVFLLAEASSRTKTKLYEVARRPTRAETNERSDGCQSVFGPLRRSKTLSGSSFSVSQIGNRVFVDSSG